MSLHSSTKQSARESDYADARTIVCFGTYDSSRHPRVRALIEGLAAHGYALCECNVALNDSTRARVDALRHPVAALSFGVSVLRAWWRLWRRGKQLAVPDVVLVGYLGHLDVHLARWLWPDALIVLDHLVSLADTADDRGVGRLLQPLLRAIDRAAVSAANIVLVDTEEQAKVTPVPIGTARIVVPVGAPTVWFTEPQRRDDGRLRVVFFGLYTPLQGAPVIGQAIGLLTEAPIQFHMIGTGQDYEKVRRAAARNPHVVWSDWIPGDELPLMVADHDVCLGIFGTSTKALRVVPNKVFQGAAAGCAIVTSDTRPQRAAMADAAVYVQPGSPVALAHVLSQFAANRDDLWRSRLASYNRARAAFSPVTVVEALSTELARRLDRRAETRHR